MCIDVEYNPVILEHSKHILMILIGYLSGGFKPFWILKPNQGFAMHIPKTAEFSEYHLLGFLKCMFAHFFQTEEATNRI